MKKRKFAWIYGGLAVFLLAVAVWLAVGVAADSIGTPWITPPGLEEETEEDPQDETTTDSAGAEQSPVQEEATAKETPTTKKGEVPLARKKGCGSIVSFSGIGIYFLLAGAAGIATKAGRRN